MMNKLAFLLANLEEKVPFADRISPSVSESSVGWHIDHSLIVFNTICDAVINSDPSKYKWKFNFMRTLVYTMGRMPRGKVQAPKLVVPTELFDKDRLIKSFERARKGIERLDGISKDAYFRHPFFGDLNVRPTKKFLMMHTRHHLNIIKDILKS